MATSLYPAPSHVLPPYIVHLTAEQSYDSTLSFLCDESSLPPSLVKELVAFGAVYYREGSGEKAKLNRLRHLPPRSSVPKGSYARVHVNPRRYSQYYSVPNWKERVLFSNDDVVVVDKPALCIPSVETVDNLVENIINGVSTELNRRDAPLLPCGRLDACTSGVIVFAKTAAAAKKVNAAFVSNEVKKMYRALVLLPSSDQSPLLRPGPLRHLYRKKSKSHPNAKPTLLRNIDEKTPGEEGEWQTVELIIHEVGPEQLVGQSKAREVLIELVTGKTHQIRLQLLSLGHPIVGDTRLIPAAGLLDDPSSPWGDGSALFGPEPPNSIGLHCASLELLGIKFEADSPWWRDKQSKTKKEKRG